MSETPVNPPRVKGTKLLLTFDAGDNVYAQVTNYQLAHEDASDDLVTFLQASQGGSSQPQITVTVVQSTAANSLWTKLWDNSGQIVAFTLAPHGNDAPTEAQPHFTGYVQIPSNKPTLGGDAARQSPGFTSEVTMLVCTADGEFPGTVTKDTGQSTEPTA
jgi:hypothetical protein